MSDISFIISSNRQYKDQAERVVKSIRDEAEKDGRYSYEIVLFSPFKPDDDNIIWYKDNWCTGSIFGFNMMARLTSSSYICIVDDQHLLHSGVFTFVDFLNSDVFENRRFKIATLKSGGACYLEKNRYNQKRWDNLLVVRFPVFTRDTLKKLNNWLFHPSFKHRYADNYLGWFLWANQEPGLEVPDGFIKQFDSSLGRPYDSYDEDLMWWLIDNAIPSRYVEKEEIKRGIC